MNAFQSPDGHGSSNDSSPQESSSHDEHQQSYDRQDSLENQQLPSLPQEECGKCDRLHRRARRLNRRAAVLGAIGGVQLGLLAGATAVLAPKLGVLLRFDLPAAMKFSGDFAQAPPGTRIVLDEPLENVPSWFMMNGADGNSLVVPYQLLADGEMLDDMREQRKENFFYGQSPKGPIGDVYPSQGSGSMILIDGQEYFLSAHHCFTSLPREDEAELIANEPFDIALRPVESIEAVVSVGERPYATVSEEITDENIVGRQVVVMGLGIDLYAYTGEVIELPWYGIDSVGFEGERLGSFFCIKLSDYDQIDMLTAKGCSGAPVMDVETGEQVGVLSLSASLSDGNGYIAFAGPDIINELIERVETEQAPLLADLSTP